MNRTKDAIIDAFWQLLEEKPYSKITVKDIVDRCQINRNTFYYHYHDIPELLEYAVRKDTDHIIQSYSKFGSLMDCIAPLVNHCMSRKKAILHIYRSVQREIFLNELEQTALYTVTQYVDTVAPELPVHPEDKALLIRFYKCTIVGILLDWMTDGMRYDLLSFSERICELLAGSARQAFRRSADLPFVKSPQNS